jgi:TRAP transporter 4TM/12TM fusion protein
MTDQITALDDEVKELRTFTGVKAMLITLLCISYTALEVLGLQFVVIDIWVFMVLVLILIFILGYLKIPFRPQDKGNIRFLDWTFMAMGVAPCIYILLEMERLQWTYGTVVEPLDIVFSILLMISLLELNRRAFGWAMPLTALAFLAYALFGGRLPSEFFGHAGLRPENVIGFMLGPMAIFGSVMVAMVQIIFLFMLFSTFLQMTGAGDFFVNLANSFFGRWRGGAAKISVFSSSLFGTISGSSVANVAVDGGITIPLMIKTGFRPAFAAAVEATASTGGQIMPPVMGAGAFIMAELLNIPYGDVIVAATLPAILYYVGLFFMVDLEAVRQGLRGSPKEQFGKAWPVIKEGAHLLIPVAILVYELIWVGASMARAGLISIAAIVIVSWFRKSTRMGLRKFIQAVSDGAESTIGIGAICASSGIIVGCIAITGLGVSFSSVVLALSQGSLFITLLLTAIICMILGLGLPTTASYIITAAVGAPALLKLGVSPLAAHLFIFYYAAVSAITPPVCGAVYTACGFSGSEVMKTGWIATRLGFAAYLAPFIFVYHPALLLNAPLGEVLWASTTAIIGIAVISMAFIGSSYFWDIRWNMVQRILLFFAALLLVYPDVRADIAGSLTLVVAFFSHRAVRQKFFGLFKGVKKPEIAEP